MLKKEHIYHYRQMLLALVMVMVTTVHCCGQLTYETVTVLYDSPWTCKNLSLIPIKFKQPAPAFSLQPNGITTLQQAVNSGKAKIKEVIYENGADVNWLHITNETKQNLFINSGELLAGGKQDRMVAEATLIEPGTSAYLKVFCVEKGRWDDKAKAFTHSGNADFQLKKVMDQVGRQADVWKEIEKQFASQNKNSDTWPYLQLRHNNTKTDSVCMQFFLKKYLASDSNYAGFLALFKGEIVSCELFASASLTSLAFPGIVSSITSIAMSKSPDSSNANDDVKQFMDNLLRSEASQRVFVLKRGVMHKYRDKVFHVVAYGL